MEQVDILIVGQGLAGSILALEAEKHDLTFKIIDNNIPITSSKVAAGLYNPFTGRKMVKTWLADELFGDLGNYYSDLEEKFQTKFHYQLPIFHPFESVANKNDWNGKLSQEDIKPFVNKIYHGSPELLNLFSPFGGLEQKLTGYVDVPKFLQTLKTYFIDRGSLIHKLFDYNLFDPETGIFADTIQGKKIVFCEGPNVVENPFWKHLKFGLLKGEIMDIEAEASQNFIINRGVFMIPKSDYYTVGSTYNRENLELEVSKLGIETIEQKLKGFFKGKYRILNTRAGIRPATYNRRPFIGFHDEFDRVGIFNGFGTKGVSLVPLMAKEMMEFIKMKKALRKEVSVTR